MVKRKLKKETTLALVVSSLILGILLLVCVWVDKITFVPPIEQISE